MLYTTFLSAAIPAGDTVDIVKIRQSGSMFICYAIKCFYFNCCFFIYQNAHASLNYMENKVFYVISGFSQTSTRRTIVVKSK